MSDCMTFPKTADDFIKQYSFKDSKQEYTNGAELIPVFRVKQMLEHYDLMEWVRCKDCKHFKYYKKTALCVDGKTVPAGWCSRRTRYEEDIRMLPDDFCSYGERKEK